MVVGTLAALPAATTAARAHHCLNPGGVYHACRPQGLLLCQLSSLSHRSAAEDYELQAPVEGTPQASGPSIPGISPRSRLAPLPPSPGSSVDEGALAVWPAGW